MTARPHENQPPIPYGFKDRNGNAWCDQWVDSYNRMTERINNSGNGVSGSLSEREREFLLDQRHRTYEQFVNIAAGKLRNRPKSESKGMEP